MNLVNSKRGFTLKCWHIGGREHLNVYALCLTPYAWHILHNIMNTKTAGNILSTPEQTADLKRIPQFLLRPSHIHLLPKKHPTLNHKQVEHFPSPTRAKCRTEQFQALRKSCETEDPFKFN